jgi:hypothetical protein
VDVDGDGSSTFADHYIFNHWASRGGKWTSALEEAIARGDVLDVSAFFRSPSAALSEEAVVTYPEEGTEVSESEPSGPHYVALHAGNVTEDPALAAAFESPLALELHPAEAVLSFLATHQVLRERLGLDRVEVRVTAAYEQPVDGRVVVNGDLCFEDVPIQHGSFHASVSASTGKLRRLNFLDVSGWDFSPSQPGLPSERAIESVLLEDSDATPSEITPRLLFVPLREGKTFRLAWEVITAEAARGTPKDRYIVDAFDGSVLEKGPALLQGQVTGTVMGFSTPLSSHLPDFSGNPPVSLPVPDLNVSIQPGNVTATTALDGSFAANPTGGGPFTATATLNEGPFIHNLTDTTVVTDQAVGMTGLQLVLNDDPDHPMRQKFTYQLNAWQWVVQSRRFLDTVFARTLTPFPGGFWNCTGVLSSERTRFAIDLAVNIVPVPPPPPAPQTTCGSTSYYDDFSSCKRLNLIAKTSPVHNQAFASIVCHEYGHHFTWEMTRRNATQHNRIHAEGLGDIFASFVLGDAKMARGWHIDHEMTDFLRDLETSNFVPESQVCTLPAWPTVNTYVWPQEPGFPASPYRQAMPFSGAWWDLRTRLAACPGDGARVAEDLLVRFYEGRFGDALELITFEYADELLEVDDKPYFGGDDNLANGSPHSAEIIDAFVRRNLFLNSFRRGDANADGVVNVSDAQAILNYLFSGGSEPPCLDAADANDNAVINISDAQFILNFLFGTCSTPPCPPPPAPGPFTCGREPVTSWADRITCIAYPPCAAPPVLCQ